MSVQTVYLEKFYICSLWNYLLILLLCNYSNYICVVLKVSQCSWRNYMSIQTAHLEKFHICSLWNFLLIQLLCNYSNYTCVVFKKFLSVVGGITCQFVWKNSTFVV